MAKRDRDPEPEREPKMRRAAETAHARLLDDPKIPDQPSGPRHLAYFAVVMAFALVLNLVVLILVAR